MVTEVSAAAHFTVIAELRPNSIVEIGSYLGRSTVFYAKCLEVLGIDGRVTAIDPHTGDRQHLENLGVEKLTSFEMFEQHLATTNVAQRVHPIVAPSHEASKGWSRRSTSSSSTAGTATRRWSRTATTGFSI